MDAPAAAGSHPLPSSSVYGVCCPGSLSQEPTRTASAVSRVPAAPSTRRPVLPSWRSKPALLATIAAVVALGYSWQTDLYVEAWRGGWSCARMRLALRRLQPAAALDRGAAVREHERGQGAGVLLRRAHRGAAQLADRDQRATGRRTHLGVLIQRQGHRHRHDRAQTECRRGP